MILKTEMAQGVESAAHTQRGDWMVGCSGRCVHAHLQCGALQKPAGVPRHCLVKLGPGRGKADVFSARPET